jgi:hypothetical protein
MIVPGGALPAKFCHRYLPQARIQVVEINPHVIAPARRVPSERFTVVHGDGAQFVRLRATRCNLPVVDGFDSRGLPSRLCSQRFYDVHVGRIRRSFNDAVLVVDDGELSNSIVFACKGARTRAIPPVRRASPEEPRQCRRRPTAGAVRAGRLGTEGSAQLVVGESHVIHVRCACNVIAIQHVGDPRSSRPRG